jgi:hypothetical protein
MLVNQQPLIGQSTLPGGQVSGAQLGQSIKGESRFEQVPYERSYMEYEAVQREEQIPVQRMVTEYQTQYKTEYVPVERKVQDFYTIEYQTEY